MKRTAYLRSAVSGATIAALTLLASGCGSDGGSPGDSSDPIKVGSVLDATGPLNIYGTGMVDATNLAVQDINDNGGVLGRQLELVSYDAQSDNSKYTQYANTLTTRDQVSVLMGGISSASREAIRPIADRNKTLYFYNEQYEGGVCDGNTINTGAVPSQQLAALIPYAIQQFGPRIAVIAADYNFGHISTDWVKKYAADAGGEVVSTEFIPLDSSDFGSVTNGLQGTAPDVVVSLLVGGNHIAFYRQFASAGLGQSMNIVSTSFGLGNEQLQLSSQEGQGIVVAFPYFQELDNPANQAFVDLWHQKYGADYGYITDSAVAVWNGWHLWAEAVEKAGSLDRDAVLKVLEAGVGFDAPSGQVTLNGASHHVTQDVSIGQVNANQGFDILETESAVAPAFENEVCDLIKHPDTNEQFTP